MAARRRALIRTDPEQIASIFPATASRLLLPGVEPISYVMPPEVGWEGFGFRIAEVVPADPVPEGKREISRTVELVDGVPVEILTLEDLPKPTIEDLLAYAADKRWHVETAGIEVGGAFIDTSRESQAMITGAYAYSQANPAEMISYKAASGWATLDASTMAAIAVAVGTHVQACFAAEATIADDILLGEISTTAEIDASDWPSAPE
jgi:hypothetical protein